MPIASDTFKSTMKKKENVPNQLHRQPIGPNGNKKKTQPIVWHLIELELQDGWIWRIQDMFLCGSLFKLARIGEWGKRS